MLDESKATWLFMVDSDMGFDPDTVDRLVESAGTDHPVVGGLAFALKTDGRSSLHGIKYRPVPTLYDWVEDDKVAGFTPRLEYPRGELVKVAATGGACLLIRRDALAAVRDKYGDVWFDTIRHKKGGHFSEDLSFCIRLAGVDIATHVDTGIRTTHDKGGVFVDEAFFDAHMSRKGD